MMHRKTTLECWQDFHDACATAWGRLTYPLRRTLARYLGETDVPDTYDEAKAQAFGDPR